MFPNVVFGTILLALGIFINHNIFFTVYIYILSILFLIAPFVMWYISRKRIALRRIDKLNKDEKVYINAIAKETWEFFSEFMNKGNSFMPPDNFQESRREKVVDRTSSTNIGLGILAIISAYDLKFISLEKAIANLENTMEKIDSLEKWKGHLYNWYNIKTLKPLNPKYVSTVDSRKLYTAICIL